MIDYLYLRDCDPRTTPAPFTATIIKGCHDIEGIGLAAEAEQAAEHQPENADRVLEDEILAHEGCERPVLSLLTFCL